MRKLTLEVERLAVESFETDAAVAVHGTVRAHYGTTDPLACETKQGPACGTDQTCDVSCQNCTQTGLTECEPTCAGQHTCDPSLEPWSCPPDCPG
jgi:hypothetical protein